MYLDALIVGGDEGFELYKAFAVYSGQHLYTEIWDDQPSLWTQILVAIFNVTGPSVIAARVVATLFGILLCVAVVQIAKINSQLFRREPVGRDFKEFGAVRAVVILLVLVGSRGTLTWLVSVMQEVPAFAVAASSLWALMYFAQRRPAVGYWISVLLFAVSLHIKLTTVLLIPGIGMALLLLQEKQDTARRGTFGEWIRYCWRASILMAGWGAAVLVLFFLFALVLGDNYRYFLWDTHFNPLLKAAMAKTLDYKFEMSLVVKDAAFYAIALIGIVGIMMSGRWRVIVIPGTLLLAALAVHTNHKPWWSYYYLHLALPLAWLCGEAVVGILRHVPRLIQPAGWRTAFRIPYLMANILIGAWAATYASCRLFSEIQEKMSARSASDEKIVKRLRANSDRIQCFYCRDPIYAFHAKLLLPPQLAVISAIRSMSGDISDQKILAVLKEYKPDQMLLGHCLPSEEWNEYVRANYTVAYSDDSNVLYEKKAR